MVSNQRDYVLPGAATGLDLKEMENRTGLMYRRLFGSELYRISYLVGGSWGWGVKARHVLESRLRFWAFGIWISLPESTEIGRLDHSEVAMAVREMSDRMLFAKRWPFLSQVGSGSDKKDREKVSEH